MNRTTYIFALLAIAAALFASGCGGEGSSGGYGGKDSSATAETGAREGSDSGGPTGGAVVSVANVPGLGRVLVDTKGFTLYDFHKDKGAKSFCYGDCAQVWPPLVTSGKPQGSNGAAAAKLGTTKRSDGSAQVTYAGHPLYTYVEDKKPGDGTGNDIDSFGAEWYALRPSGQEPED